MEQVKFEIRKIKELVPYENNTRKHGKEDVEKIKTSIKQYGFNDPIGIWSDKNIVVEGHGRLKAAKALGLTEVPCVRLDHLNDEQRKQYAIAHNRTAEFSEWDFDVLKDEMADLDFGDLDLDFDFEDENEEKAAVEDGYDGEVPEEPTSKVGQLFKLGRHRLLCGDSTILQDVERLTEGVKADLLITDPPYNVDYTGKTKDALKIDNDHMEDSKFRDFLNAAFSNACAVMKPGASFYIWHADSEGYNFRGACKDSGLTVRQCIIWNKNSMVMGRQDYQWKHEPCLYGWKEGAGHLWASDRKQTTVLNFDKPNASKIHPTMKPIPLFDYQIKNNTKGDDNVLDLFGGSGTTLMACEQNGRNAFLMEYDPRYVDAIIKRWETFTGLKAELISE